MDRLFKSCAFILLTLLMGLYSAAHTIEPEFNGVTVNDYLVDETPLLAQQFREDNVKYLLTSPPTMHLKWKNGNLYITYNNVFQFDQYATAPKLYIDDDGVLVITTKDNSQWGHWTSFTVRGFKNISFNLEYSGKVRVMPFMKYIPKNPYYITLTAQYDLDCTIRLDSKETTDFFLPGTEWTYAMVRDGKLTGQFSVERFSDDTTCINGYEYKTLLHCEGDTFNPDQAYPIAYMRNDGLKYYVLGVDAELPASIWTDAIDGTVNPYKITEGKEYALYDLYNYLYWSTAYPDVLANRREFTMILSETTVKPPVYEPSWEITPTSMRPFTLPVKQLTLRNGGLIREGVGFLGDCIHSLAYPSHIAEASTSGAKIIMVDQTIPETESWPERDEHLRYIDENLYAEFKNIISKVNDITDNNTGLVTVSGTTVTYNGTENAELRLYNPDGILIVSKSGIGPFSLEFTDRSRKVGIFTLKTPDTSLNGTFLVK